MNTRLIVRPTIVYVSGPITTGGNIPVNVRLGILAGQAIRKRGYVVICPHERIVTEMLDPHDYEWWMQNDFAEIEASDVLYRMAGDDGRTLPSHGGDREVKHAEKIGRPVYWSLDTLFTVPTMRRMEVVSDVSSSALIGVDFCLSCGHPKRVEEQHIGCRGAA